MTGLHDVSGFARWVSEVDQEVQRRIALRARDLPDAPLKEWYDEGLSSTEAASELLARGVL